MTIQVTFVNGRLVGRRWSDRWNLDWMARDFCGVRLYDASDVGTKAEVTRLRHRLALEGFALKLFKDGQLLDITARERAAFPPLSRVATPRAVPARRMA